MKTDEVMQAAAIPIACNLPAIEQAARGAEISEDIFKGCQQVEELADGYAFRFTGEEQWGGRLLNFIIEEQKCCPFFRFEIIFEPAKGAIWLHLRGAAGVKEFIEANFGDNLRVEASLQIIGQVL